MCFFTEFQYYFFLEFFTVLIICGKICSLGYDFKFKSSYFFTQLFFTFPLTLIVVCFTLPRGHFHSLNHEHVIYICLMKLRMGCVTEFEEFITFQSKILSYILVWWSKKSHTSAINYLVNKGFFFF